MVWLKSTPAGSKSIAKRAVGRWCLVAIDRANTMLLKLSKSTQKCTNRSAERERAQGSATAHSALLPLRLKWKAVIKEHHNHDPSPEPTSHPSHRRAGIANLSESSKQTVERLRLRNTPVSTVRAQLGDMGVKVTSKDLYNMKQRARNAQLGGLIAVGWLYDTLHLSLRTTASNLRVAKGFAGGACLALMLIFSCVASPALFFIVSTLPIISLELAKSSLELEKPYI